MNTLKRSLRVTLMCVVATAFAVVGLPMASAHANLIPPSASYDIGLIYGNVQRAEFRENSDGSGMTIRVFGSSSCSVTGSDRDITVSSLINGWNDNISWAKDMNACDVVQFMDTNLTGSSMYVDYGTSGHAVASGWNDAISSFYLT